MKNYSELLLSINEESSFEARTQIANAVAMAHGAIGEEANEFEILHKVIKNSNPENIQSTSFTLVLLNYVTILINRNNTREAEIILDEYASRSAEGLSKARILHAEARLLRATGQFSQSMQKYRAACREYTSSLGEEYAISSLQDEIKDGM